MCAHNELSRQQKQRHGALAENLHWRMRHLADTAAGRQREEHGLVDAAVAIVDDGAHT